MFVLQSMQAKGRIWMGWLPATARLLNNSDAHWVCARETAPRVYCSVKTNTFDTLSGPLKTSRNAPYGRRAIHELHAQPPDPPAFLPAPHRVRIPAGSCAPKNGFWRDAKG